MQWTDLLGANPSLGQVTQALGLTLCPQARSARAAEDGRKACRTHKHQGLTWWVSE